MLKGRGDSVGLSPNSGYYMPPPPGGPYYLQSGPPNFTVYMAGDPEIKFRMDEARRNHCVNGIIAYMVIHMVVNKGFFVLKNYQSIAVSRLEKDVYILKYRITKQHRKFKIILHLK